MDENHHSTVILNDGRELGLAWLTPDDRGKLFGFMEALPEKDLGRLGLDYESASVLDACLNEDENRPCRLLAARDAEQGDRLAGLLVFYRGGGGRTHMARVETALHPAYRDLGLGSGLLREVIAYTSRAGLLLLVMEVHIDEKDLIVGVKRLGFEPKAIIEDYRVDRRGATYDVIVMIKRLQYPSNKEFLYRY
jgi:ribosomal protein S18 acetylase RimI-like enzyme